MAELWGAVLQALGVVLDWIFRVIPSYGVALILLTLVTRAIIAPLGVKQIRSMQKMQRIQPELKKIQTKYKGDRQKMNEEMMKLYKEYGVNPLGGCIPMIAQFPVFIALYAVIRAVIPITAAPATPVERPTKTVLCRPNTFPPSVDGTSPTAITCTDKGKDPKTYAIGEWHEGHTGKPLAAPSYLVRCKPRNVGSNSDFVCESPLGTGHLPKDGKLFAALVEDKATFLGLHLACSPNQASTSDGAKQCTASGKKASGAGIAMYYLLVAAMAGTTYFQQRQMQQKQPSGQQAQQMKMMMTVMPVVFGFLSLQFPAALSIYWVTGNAWTIIQQKLIFGKEEAATSSPQSPAAKQPPAAKKEKKGKK